LFSPSSRDIMIDNMIDGKSSLTIQFVEGQFVDSYDPTIENTFTKMITVNGQEYHLQLVDTAGQDEYSIFPQTYSIDINGYILVYSVTSNKSFEVVKVIHEKLLDMVGKVQVPIMLVGNKKDLHMERVISCEEGKALAESWNAAFMESSAKENQVMMRFLSLPLPLPLVFSVSLCSSLRNCLMILLRDTNESMTSDPADVQYLHNNQSLLLLYQNFHFWCFHCCHFFYILGRDTVILISLRYYYSFYLCFELVFIFIF
uniref:GTP-binding protein Rheb n=1 Tax=Sinocyclocheilus rhinocerous TaxID=307959 RepID=A0A673G8Y9_9TELE